MLALLKDRYWIYTKKRRLLAKLKQPENAYFWQHIKQQKIQLGVLNEPAGSANNQICLEAAVDWLLRAQSATSDNGVSLGYFPLSEYQGWMPSYPETTGYIITSLLLYAEKNAAESIKQAAIAMADWEIKVQMPSGAVQGGTVCSAKQQTAAAFNTGMVIDGWISAFEQTQQQKYLDAAVKAASFLAQDMGDQGFFKTNGEFVRDNEVKTYTCLCAWGMYRTGKAAHQPALMKAAVNAIESALQQRNEKGWFRNNCLTHSTKPLTHTIGYVLQGILEVGILAGRSDFVAAFKHSLSGALSSMDESGRLAGRLDDNWHPKASYVCLTGSAQLAILCFRLAEHNGDQTFVTQGHKLTGFVKATQVLCCENNGIKGAIAGSYPIIGDYMVAGYPNWATKYYIDALMLQDKIGVKI
jgi:hypothetical protein